MAFKTIRIKDYTNILLEDRLAAAAITPGHLVEITSSNTVQKHSTAGGNVVPVLFAVENELEGEDIDNAYAASDVVKVHCFRSGDEVYAYLKAGTSYTVGMELESDGSGQLQQHTKDSGAVTEMNNQIVGKVVVATDLSASAAVATRARVMIA